MLVTYYYFTILLQDAGYYMSRDRINDMLVEPIINMVDYNAILACQDRYVRCSNLVKQEITVESVI